MFNYNLRKNSQYYDVSMEIEGQNVELGLLSSYEMVKLAEEMSAMVSDLLSCKNYVDKS